MTRGISKLRRELFHLPPILDRSPNLCRNCLLARRQNTKPTPSHPLRYASTSAATASVVTPTLPSQPSVSPPVTAVASSPYALKAGIVLSRPPLITRDPTPFEKSFYLYQRRLNERLALPFPRYFYYQKGTPEDAEWKAKMRQRASPARDIGNYSAYGPEAWNDEVLVGAVEAEPDVQVEAILRDSHRQVEDRGGDAEAAARRSVDVDRPRDRITEADRKGDEGNLERKLQRTLYLLVQGKEGRWEFPAGELEGRESLVRAAERLLVEAGGINMNTWVVGNAPVGHYANKYDTPIHKEGQETLGEKTFFMKARIMAGQFSLRHGKMAISSFKWLAKEEVEKEVDPAYWKAVKNMLVDL